MAQGTYSLPVRETVRTAWDKVGGVKGSIWAVIGIFFLIQVVLGICASLFAQGFFNFVSSLVQIVTGISLVYIGIRRAQGAPISYKMIKEVLTLRVFLCIIGLYILQTLIFIPAGIVLGIGIYLTQAQAESSTLMNLVGFLFDVAAIVIFIYLSVRLWIAYAVVVDKKANPWEAVKTSFKDTKGNVWNLIGLFIITMLILIGCAITLGIGLIWGLPWMLIIYGEVYKRLNG